MTTTEPSLPGEPIQPDVNEPDTTPLFDPEETEGDNPDDGDDGDNLTGA